MYGPSSLDRAYPWMGSDSGVAGRAYVAFPIRIYPRLVHIRLYFMILCLSVFLFSLIIYFYYFCLVDVYADAIR